MSYTINEGVSDAESNLRCLKQIQEKYPDATMQSLPGGERVYVSDRVKPNAVAISIKDGEAWFCPYISDDGARIFTDHWDYVRVESFLRIAGGTKGEWFKQFLTVLADCK